MTRTIAASRDAQPRAMPRDRRLAVGDLINRNGDDDSRSTSTQQQQHQQHPIYRFHEFGREYYAYNDQVVYPFPCDDEECRRLDCFHCMIHDVALGGRLHLTELHARSYRPQILDLGCGTGIWVYEMAERYPCADVLGIDLLDMQPARIVQMPNAYFRTPVDITQPDWNLKPASFDMIRMSQLCGCIPDWTSTYRNILKHLRPGIGCVEHIEIDWEPRCWDTVAYPSKAAPFQDWWYRMKDASDRTGKSFNLPYNMDGILRAAGFTDTAHKTIRIPLRLQSRERRDDMLKRWYKVEMSQLDDRGNRPQGFEALSLSYFVRQLSLSEAYVRDICDALRTVSAPDDMPLYHNIHIWTARKPEA